MFSHVIKITHLLIRYIFEFFRETVKREIFRIRYCIYRDVIYQFSINIKRRRKKLK